MKNNTLSSLFPFFILLIILFTGAFSDTTLNTKMILIKTKAIHREYIYCQGKLVSLEPDQELKVFLQNRDSLIFLGTTLSTLPNDYKFSFQEKCGDLNADGIVDIGDIIRLIAWVFYNTGQNDSLICY